MMPSRPVYDSGVLRITRAGSPPVVAISGEIDESTYAALVQALDDVAQDQSELHIDLSELVYCDLAGLRAMVRLTSGNGAGPGRTVGLHRVPSQLRAVLDITGWDAIPGLAVTGPED
jgi:anti-anti-sigma factor